MMPSSLIFCGSLLEKRSTKQWMLCSVGLFSNLVIIPFANVPYFVRLCSKVANIFFFFVGLFFVGKETHKTWNVGNIKYDVSCNNGMLPTYLASWVSFPMYVSFPKETRNKGMLPTYDSQRNIRDVANLSCFVDLFSNVGLFSKRDPLWITFPKETRTWLWL